MKGFLGFPSSLEPSAVIRIYTPSYKLTKNRITTFKKKNIASAGIISSFENKISRESAGQSPPSSYFVSP
jgi:hypothetical protein